MMRKWNCYLPCLEGNNSSVFICILPCRETQIQVFFDQVWSHRRRTLPWKVTYFMATVCKRCVLWQQHFFCHSNEVLKELKIALQPEKYTWKQKCPKPPMMQTANRRILYLQGLESKWSEKGPESWTPGGALDTQNFLYLPFKMYNHGKGYIILQQRSNNVIYAAQFKSITFLYNNKKVESLSH